MNRREFLALLAAPAMAQESSKPDFELRIGNVSVEIAPGRVYKTTGFNGSVPGPLMRCAEGKPVTIAVHNDTSAPDITHWHGLTIPSNVDGSMEEGTPMISAHGLARYTFTPRPSGTRWYHTHTAAGRDLRRGLYNGQFGFFVIDAKSEPGAFDQEIFLALRGWDPYFNSSDDGGMEVAYTRYSINSHALGAGEPVRVKQGQRVLFRILNASATLHHRIALAGHVFRVTALDGNPVPTPREVETLELGPAERIDAIVTMNQPGVWVLGEVDDHLRTDGLGVVIEYANRSGKPQWTAPGASAWDYARFGDANPEAAPEAERVPLVFKKKFAGSRWVDHWTVNGKEFPKSDPIRVREGMRYRLIFDNQSDEQHPVHLHRHSFELTGIADVATRGVMKDVVVVPPKKRVEVDLIADNPGPTLFHCHQQMHMDYGFMCMMNYI
jgi:FtsP/CotA-like multicopper oxidase with cupredoxin domain